MTVYVLESSLRWACKRKREGEAQKIFEGTKRKKGDGVVSLREDSIEEVFVFCFFKLEET